MCCMRLLKRIISFAITLIVGIIAGNFVYIESDERKLSAVGEPVTLGSGSSGRPIAQGPGPGVQSIADHKMEVISKPRPSYTEEARKASTSGVVRLKVTFLASGQIGAVTPITELPNGLTEQAIAAARRIEFTPKMVNGIPVTLVRTVEYSFTIY
jgi:TonB family protein